METIQRLLRERKRYLFVATLFFLIAIIIFVLHLNDQQLPVKELLVTNVTDTGFTVTWVSDEPYEGSLYYKEGHNWPIIFVAQASSTALDDRDISQGPDGRYSLDSNKSKPRFTHHITVRDLKPNSLYSFRLGGNITGKVIDENTVLTKNLADQILTPDPAYGSVIGVRAADTILLLKDSTSTEAGYLSILPNEESNYSFDLNLLPDTQKNPKNIEGIVVNDRFNRAKFKFKQSQYKPLEDIILGQREESVGLLPSQKSNSFPTNSFITNLQAQPAVEEGSNRFCQQNCTAFNESIGMLDWNFGTLPNAFTPTAGKAKWCQCCNRNCGNLKGACESQLIREDLSLVGPEQFNQVCSAAITTTLPPPVQPQREWCVVCRTPINSGYNGASILAGEELDSWLGFDRNLLEWQNFICNNSINNANSYTNNRNVLSGDCNDARSRVAEAQGADGYNAPVAGGADGRTLQCWKRLDNQDDVAVGSCPLAPLETQLRSGQNAAYYTYCEVPTVSELCYVPSNNSRAGTEVVKCHRSDGGFDKYRSKGDAGENIRYTYPEMCYANLTEARTGPNLRLENEVPVSNNSTDLSTLTQGETIGLAVVEVGLETASCLASPAVCLGLNTVIAIANIYVQNEENNQWQIASYRPNNLAEVTAKGYSYMYKFTVVSGAKYCGIFESNHVQTNFRTDRGLIPMVNICSIQGRNPTPAVCYDSGQANSAITDYINEIFPQILEEGFQGLAYASEDLWPKVLKPILDSPGFWRQLARVPSSLIEVYDPQEVVAIILRAAYEARDNAIYSQYSLVEPRGNTSIEKLKNACCTDPLSAETRLYLNNVNESQGVCGDASPPRRTPVGPQLRTAAFEYPSTPYLRTSESRNQSLVPLLAKSINASSDNTKVTQSGTYIFRANDQILGIKDIVVDGQEVQVKIFNDINGNDIRDEGEEYITELPSLTIEQENSLSNYKLISGWNLIHLNLVSLKNGNNIKASDLVRDWNNQGAEIIQLAKYEAGQFITYTNRGGVVFGQDFNLMPGQGYFVQNITKSLVRVNLKGFKLEGAAPISFSNGWNLVGLAKPSQDYTASKFISKLGENGTVADTISQFENGTYQSLVIDAGTTFGNDYNLVETRGYFVRVNSTTQSSLSP